ncbi:uncharacterized protein [Nicotiana sylvestris]|uniref:uncharacterized protein n=1 Tax=Nicotiana sylvestris TaxID=4096 RepID=UPI00388CE616
MVSVWGETSDEDSEDETGDEQTFMAIGESYDEQEVSVIHLKYKIKFLSKEKLSELLLDFIDESEVINNEKEQLSRECVILKAKCKNLELGASESDSKNTELKNQVLELDTTVLELRSKNLKLKLGTGKKKVDLTHLNLEENLGKMKDELYKRDEQIRVLKEDKGKGSSQLWYMDSGCSKHMTGSKNQFLSLEDLKGGNVSFGNGKKCDINWVGKVGKMDSHSIENVYLIDCLKYSLISVSQLCDKDLSILSENELTCLSVLDNDPLLWCMTRPLVEKTPYELLKGIKPKISHLRAFGCKCFVHNNGKDSLGKFDPRSNEEVFLGYSSHNKVYKVSNKRTLCVEESVHVVFDETNILSKRQEHEDEAIGLVKELSEVTAQAKTAPKEGTGDGTGSSIQGNMTGGTEQRRTETNPQMELVHEPVPQ